MSPPSRRAAVFVLLAVTAFVRSYDCLRGFVLTQDDVQIAFSVLHAGDAGFLDFLPWIFRQGGYTYTPLTNILYWILHALGWGVPAGIRCLAAALLALTAFLAYLVAARFVRDRRWALAAGLFYVLHPVHNLNTTCTAIPHYLAAIFTLSALLIHMQLRERAMSPRRIAALGALYLAAALSKETGLLLPAFLLSFDLTNPPRRRAFHEYAALLAAALLYAVVRWGLNDWGAAPDFSNVAGHLVEAVTSWSLPLAFALMLPPLLSRGKKAASGRLLVFCAAWFLIGISLCLLVLPGLELSGRHLLLAYLGAAWALAVALDTTADRWGARWCVPAAALVLLAMRADGSGHIGCDSRTTQLRGIRFWLSRCAVPSAKMQCYVNALSLPLIKKGDPAGYAKLAGLLPPADAETILEFFGDASYGKDHARWRYLSQEWNYLTGGSQDAGRLRNFLEAERLFAAGSAHLQAGRYAQAAASSRAAVRLWPGYLEAHFQNARALHADGKQREAEASYAQAVAGEAGRHNRGRLVREYCAAPASCAFIEP